MSVRDLIILGCASQHPTRRRNHGAYLIRWNEEGFLFDPGEGTQRQFIYANVAPPTVTRIFVSHFHGDHCLGLGSMLMRLNLDKVDHPIHCYYPASGKKYFDRLRYGTSYHENIHVIEHPIDREGGIVHDDGKFCIEAFPLDHGIDNLGYRITEPDMIKFDKEKLVEMGVKGPLVRKLQDEGRVVIDGRTVLLESVSHVQKGEVMAVVLDTRKCENAVACAKDARLLLCESTYLDSERKLAHQYKHMTATQAAEIAKEAGAKQLVLTHFSARYQQEDAFEQEAKLTFANSHAAADLKRFELPKAHLCGLA